MRCSCRACGTYMVQSEQGLESGCVCPECGNRCSDCMGTAQGPRSVEELMALYALGVLEDMPEEAPGEVTAGQDAPRDWRREL